MPCGVISKGRLETGELYLEFYRLLYGDCRLIAIPHCGIRIELTCFWLQAWKFISSSLRSGERAENVMALIQSAKINGLDPQGYLRDVLERMPTTRGTDLDVLLPHKWKAPVKAGRLRRRRLMTFGRDAWLSISDAHLALGWQLAYGVRGAHKDGFTRRL